MNTIITKYHSSKITILNLVLIIMMLYRHAYYFEAENGNGIALGVQRFIDYGLCNLTNSLFFVLSGFLFFKNISSPTQCLPKIKKRIRSLLVPYVIWNCSFVVFYHVINASRVGSLYKYWRIGQIHIAKRWALLFVRHTSIHSAVVFKRLDGICRFLTTDIHVLRKTKVGFCSAIISGISFISGFRNLGICFRRYNCNML